jgi:hypothetical protein
VSLVNSTAALSQPRATVEAAAGANLQENLGKFPLRTDRGDRIQVPQEEKTWDFLRRERP